MGAGPGLRPSAGWRIRGSPAASERHRRTLLPCAAVPSGLFSRSETSGSLLPPSVRGVGSRPEPTDAFLNPKSALGSPRGGTVGAAATCLGAPLTVVSEPRPWTIFLNWAQMGGSGAREPCCSPERRTETVAKVLAPSTGPIPMCCASLPLCFGSRCSHTRSTFLLPL